MFYFICIVQIQIADAYQFSSALMKKSNMYTAKESRGRRENSYYGLFSLFRRRERH